jgi:predicted transport protein
LKAFKEADYNIKPATLNMGKVKNSVKEGDVKDIGHYSTGKTELIIKEKSEISYVLSLINGLMKEVEV